MASEELEANVLLETVAMLDVIEVALEGAVFGSGAAAHPVKITTATIAIVFCNPLFL